MNPMMIPTTNVIINAGKKANPFRIIQEKTTELKLMALPTERSIFPEIMRSVNAPLRVSIGTPMRRMLMTLSGLRKCPGSKKRTSSNFIMLKIKTISINTA